MHPSSWRRHASWLIALAAGCSGASAGRPGFFTELPLGAGARMPVPAANPLLCERVVLGRRLFFDPSLSRSGTISCATCHVPERGFTDGRPLPVGEGGAVGRRHAPTLLDRAYGQSQFWDGRVASLEDQALLPLTSPVELGSSPGDIERRLAGDRTYRRAFRAAFGSEEVTVQRAAQALASFVRTLVTGDAPIDRFLVLRDSSALTPAQRRGFELFQGRARCVTCHEPLRFTDERFHNTGVAWTGDRLADSGRFNVSGRSEDLGAFKTPTLRNVALTAPYMHDGSLATLEEVLSFYDRGGNPNPHLDPLVRPLNLSPEERSELLALLEALTGTIPMPPGGTCR